MPFARCGAILNSHGTILKSPVVLCMITDMSKDVLCNVCGSNDSRVLFKAKDLNYHTTDEIFSIVKCKHCGLVYINPQPLDMRPYYPKDYIPYQSAGADTSFKHPFRRALELFYHYPSGEKIRPAKVIARIKSLHKLLEIHLKDKFFLYKIPYDRKKRILDIGCGNGGYLLSLKALGWDASTQLYGIDFPNALLKQLREDEHINIVEGNFIETALPESFFDVVTLRHVLEHLPDPARALRKVFAMLKPGGVVLIHVPNFRSAEALFIFRERWRHLDAPRHLFHFSPGTMKTLLQNTGFSVEKISLKRASLPFIKSLEAMGYPVPKPVEKYIIRNMLKLFKLLGFSGELLCKAVKAPGAEEHSGETEAARAKADQADQ